MGLRLPNHQVNRASNVSSLPQSLWTLRTLQDSPDSLDSLDSPDSPDSPNSPDSLDSPDSPNSPNSPNSINVSAMTDVFLDGFSEGIQPVIGLLGELYLFINDVCQPHKRVGQVAKLLAVLFEGVGEFGHRRGDFCKAVIHAVDISRQLQLMLKDLLKLSVPVIGFHVYLLLIPSIDFLATHVAAALTGVGPIARLWRLRA